MTTLAKNYVGVDVSKKHLDVYILPEKQSFRVSNDIHGIQKIRSILNSYTIERIVCEASGGYEIQMMRSLQGEFKVWRVEPRRIKAFIYSEGIHAKTDRIDAEMMALFASKIEPRDKAKNLNDLETNLLALNKRKHDLKLMIAAEKTREKQSYDVFCSQNTQECIVFLEKKVEQVQGEIDTLIENDEVLLKKMQQLQTIPGVGKITAQAIIIELPEAGSIEGSKAAALVGVVPYTKQSGAGKGKAYIRGGRASLRKIVYMSALTASRSNPVLAEFYQRLIKTGKKPKVALTAVARKLLLIINAMLKNGKNWGEK